MVQVANVGVPFPVETNQKAKTDVEAQRRQPSAWNRAPQTKIGDLAVSQAVQRGSENDDGALAVLTQTVKGLSSLLGQWQGLADSANGHDDSKDMPCTMKTDAKKSGWGCVNAFI